MRLLLLLLLAAYGSLAQSTAVRWLDPSAADDQKIILTRKPHRVVQLAVELPAADSAGLVTLRLFRNGTPYVQAGRKMDEAPLLKARGRTVFYSDSVALQPGENVWEAEVVTARGVVIRSEALRIERRVGKPNLYLLCVGVPYNLNYTQRDAQAIFSRFKTQEGYLFGKVDGRVLICGEDTRFSTLGQTLADLRYQELTEDDVLILFFSGHGKPGQASGTTDFGLVSNDASLGVRDERYVLLFYQKDILSNISRLPCKRIVLLDACHSGAAQGNKSWIGTLAQAQDKIIQTPPGIVTIASSSGEESSWEHAAWKHGAFTYALLEALAGKADRADGQGRKDQLITVAELASYLRARVPMLVDSAYRQPQHPLVVQTSDASYPLFNYRQRGREVTLPDVPCESAGVDKKVSAGGRMAVVGVMPEKSQVDWTLTQKVVKALQTCLPDYEILAGKEVLVRDGTAMAILDGYPPPDRNLASELSAGYLCIVSRRPTRYTQDAATRKWVAQVITRFTFVSAETKAILTVQEWKETGRGTDRQSAEAAGLEVVYQKLSKTDLNLSLR